MMIAQPCRIALVTHDLSQGGGTATVVAYLHRILSDSGCYQPEIVSLSTSVRDDQSVRLISPPTWKRGIGSEDRVWRELSYRHFGANFTEFEFQRYRPRRVLTDFLNGFDLIQIVDGTPAWGGVALRCRKPLMLFTATTIKAERAAFIAEKSGWRKLYVQAMTELNERTEKRVLGRMDAVFAESTNTLERIRPIVRPKRLLLGPPGVDTGFFTRGEWHADNYILAVGRFSDPRKNVRLLLESYARLCGSFPAAPLLRLVGESPREADLELLRELGIEARVQVNVSVSQNELGALYRGAGLFVLSSDEEGLGIVILEAMASGLPVVSTDCGGPATAVSEGVTGFLTPVGDALALSKAMERIVRDPELGAKLGEAGWQKAQREFSLAATGKVYLDCYDQLLKGRRAA